MLLQVRRYEAGATDAYGNAADGLSAPQAWSVRGIAPGAMSEPYEATRDASSVVWTVYADKSGDVPGVRDVVVLDGDEFNVIGEPRDWTRGPYPNPTAGVVVELGRVEG